MPRAQAAGMGRVSFFFCNRMLEYDIVSAEITVYEACCHMEVPRVFTKADA